MLHAGSGGPDCVVESGVCVLWYWSQCPLVAIARWSVGATTPTHTLVHAVYYSEVVLVFGGLGQAGMACGHPAGAVQALAACWCWRLAVICSARHRDGASCRGARRGVVLGEIGQLGSSRA
mgnify:CR=1 FL=1